MILLNVIIMKENIFIKFNKCNISYYWVHESINWYKIVLGQ